MDSKMIFKDPEDKSGEEYLPDLYDIKIEITDVHGIAAAEINEEAIDIMQSAITSHLGEEKLLEPLITPGGDDFHFYTIKRPELKATMLGLGGSLTPGLHHPTMTFDQHALENGVGILTKAVLDVYK